MKIENIALIVTLLICAVSNAHAQGYGAEGNPFTYATTAASYLTGEPNSTYTSSGTPPTANVTVGAVYYFTVTNTDMYNSHTARAQYGVTCFLLQGGTSILDSTQSYGAFQQVIPANSIGTTNYTGTDQAEGNVAQLSSSYEANSAMGGKR